MSPSELRNIIERVSAAGPVTDLLTDAFAARGDGPKSVWYRHQKEHWLGWLSQYDGPGAYGRKVQDGRSAKFAYNHAMNPCMVLWLGEGAGFPRDILERAAAACLAAGSTMPKQCAAIRILVPWSMIEPRLRALEAARRPLHEKFIERVKAKPVKKRL